MTPDAVVIGNIIKETIVIGDSVDGPVLGSPAAYSSLAMASAGCSTGLVSFYGGDLPEQIKELAVVDTAGLIDHEFTTTDTLTYAADGSKTVTFERKAPSLGSEHVPAHYWAAKLFHVCPMDYEVELDLFDELRRRDKVVVVDLGGYGGATSTVRHAIDTPVGGVTIRRICASGAYVKASGEDLASIFPGSPIEECADRMIDLGAPLVVVTMGAAGATYTIAGEAPVHVPGYPATSRSEDGSLNFTGAGDSFDGGLMAALCESADIAEAVRFANATASLVVEGPGGCVAARMPNRRQILERMNQVPPTARTA